MSLHRALVIIVAAGLLMAPAVAQDQHVLQVKYAAGERCVTKITFTGVGTLTVDFPGGPAQPSDLWVNGRLDLIEEARSVDDRGVAEVEWRLDSMDAEFQFMGMRGDLAIEDGHLQATIDDQVVLDSLDPEQAKKYPMFSLIGQGFIVKVDRTGKIVGVPQIELLLSLMMPDADLKGAMERSTGPMPPGPVTIGDTWEERQVWPYGVPEGMERPVFVTRHTFEALETVGGHQCAKIATASSMELKDAGLELPRFMLGPLPGGMDPLGMTVNAMARDVTGTHYFDIERGTPLRWDGSATVNLDLTEILDVRNQQGQDATAAPPDADEPQGMAIGIKIEHLVIDIGLEVAA